MMGADVSIIIVNYNTGGLLLDCLSSIRDFVVVNYEVIVVDNASSDDSFSRCDGFRCDPRFRLICSDCNVGFAKGNNMAVSVSSGRFFHFLNPDTRVTADINAEYDCVLSQGDKVFVTPLVNRNGSLENPDKVIPCISDIFWWAVDRKRARYWCIGASLIIPRPVFELVGGWCEDYFMYAEDMDLFYRLWINGVGIVHLRSAVFHYGGGSSSGVWSSLEREVAVQRSFRIFYGKYFSRFQYVCVKVYFIVHDLFRHPSKTRNNILAWRCVAREMY